MGRTLVVFLFALLHVDIFLTTPVPTEPQHAAWRISRLRHSRHLGGRSGNHLSDDFLPHVVPLPARQAAAGNRKPVFSNCSRYQATVREEQNPGTAVIRVTAVDRDPPETGGTVTYTFVSAPGERLKFDIDPDTGRIVTRNVFDRDEPSREKEMYLTVRATDNGRPQLDDVCTIKVTIEDVNDNKPVFDKVNYVESVPQDLRAGREVMRISATDIDDGNNSVVTYELRPRNPELDQGYFRVDPATGVIYLNRTLDREPGYKFRMNATATDQGDPPRSSHIELEILVVESHKKAPTFTQVPERAIVLSENYNEYQRPVATLVAESNIAESELVFMILPGRTEQTNSRNTFVLESEGSTARVKLGRQLDYEAASEYTITVRVQNKYNLAAETVLNIQVLDVNDNIPVFTEVASGTVLEHEPEGAPVMQVRAIDADGTAQHSQVTYELGDHQDLFSIDPYTGNITTRVMFDREDKDFYIVKVVASDNSPSALLTTGESNKGQQVFHIEIGDINDNRPKFTKRVYFAEVTEDENIHSLVTEVRALDNDTASEVTYSLENGNVGEAFLVEKNTGKIRVANALDYENTTSYTLLVRAFDGIYDDYATVEVRVDNVNDNRPVFLPSNRNITIMEEHLVSGCITRLEAYDPDVPRREDSQRIRFFLVKEEQKRYLTLERDGCLSLVKPLDRDSPRGFPQWQVLVLARDEDGGPSSLSESTEVVINLVDINDNAPFLSQHQSVVWPENRTPGVITTLHADDLDGEGHAAPFQFSLALTAEDEIRTSFRVSVGGDGVARLEALRTFDREYRREYGVPIAISDSGSPSMTGTSTLTVVIGDENDNSMRPGASDIFVYNFKGLEDTVIGRVYVEDPDDWDLADKRFAWLGGVPHPNFQLDLRTGELSVLGDPESGSYLLEFLVVEESRLVARHAVGASVTVTVRRIPEEAVIKSGSMRLANISAENFVEPPPGKLQSRRDVLRDQLATLLNVSADNVDVFTVLPTDSGEFLDVRYSVHGSPYYAPEKLDGAVAQRLRDMELMLGVRVWTTPVDACLEENVCGAGSCVSRLVVASRPYVVTTNTSSFVGVHAAVQHECGCERVLKYQASCLNGGTPADYGCNCPPGHEGPNCEVIDVGFSGDGWAWYPPPAACETASLSLELQTDREDGLVFYLGPLSTAAGLRLSDFMSLELTEGHARLLADYGSGTTKLEQPQLKLSDGRKHRIEIHWSAASIELKVDSCATCLALTAPEGPSQLLNVNGPLQLGGTSLNLDQLAHDLGWKYTPTDQGLSGCVRNLTFSGNVYELGAPSVSHRAVAGCARAVAKAVTLGVDTNFLLVVLACTALLFALVAAAAALRGRGEAAAWRERGDEDVRENIVCYEDEGGGEGDMTGYDLSVLRLLYEETAGITKTKQAPRAAPEGMAETGSDLVESARQAEMSTDDLRHYAYEGDGDSVGSLSSLASGTDEGDLSFVQLHDFGPRFRKLADMYGGQSSDEEEV